MKTKPIENIFYNKKVKLFEEFMLDIRDMDFNLKQTIDQLKTRAESWFHPEEGEEKCELSKDTFDVKIIKSETEISTRKDLTIDFNDNLFHYKIVITVPIELDKCNIVITKYKPDETGEEFDDRIRFQTEKADEIKCKLIFDKIQELNGRDRNPDNREIESPIEEEKPEETPPAQEGTPPAQGAPPQGQPPVQGAPPQGQPPAQTPPAL